MRSAPTLYVINAAALSKPHAIEQLTADIVGYNADVVLITETHLKAKHDTSMFNIEGYDLFRRDRAKRRGGGVAVYVRKLYHPKQWDLQIYGPEIELMWVSLGEGKIDSYVGCAYHPPKPTYEPKNILDAIDQSVDELQRLSPTATITLAGDFNQLSDMDITDRTGLTPIVRVPTRGKNILDQIFTSTQDYQNVKVIKSTIRSDHMCVIAYSGELLHCYDKTHTTIPFRKQSPDQKDTFLRNSDIIPTDDLYAITDIQTAFDAFYASLTLQLNLFFPEKRIKITSRDPPYITPAVKTMLGEKSRLMRSGKVEQAAVLADKIGQQITKYNAASLTKCNCRSNASDMWAKVKQLTRPTTAAPTSTNVTASSLNEHYTTISTDNNYLEPLKKASVPPQAGHFSELTIFKMLDQLKHTATGLDNIPAWYLKLAAPLIYEQLTHLLNRSLLSSTVPTQWKTACITPLPKVTSPTTPSEYRPISITPVLSRAFERLVVQTFLYPAILNPPPTLTFSDQYAFRPSGSTTAAILSTLNHITTLLSSQEYVHVIALDFSKAFDSVRHSSLLGKMSSLDMPDHAYNWFVDFFSNHYQCTKFGKIISDTLPINASVIQGSAVGPASFLVCASDLHVISPGNRTNKYADDVIMIIPASNTATRAAEIENVSRWAKENNLTLNKSKSKEIIFFSNSKRHNPAPLVVSELERVECIELLGVTLTSDLRMTTHVQAKIVKSSSALFALRTLRSHGMPAIELQEVFRSTVLSSLLYAAPAWWGFASQENRARLDCFLRRATKMGYYPPDSPNVTDILGKADDALFKAITQNSNHVLHQFLPDKTTHSYSLRNRPHNFSIPIKTSSREEKNFLIRMLFKHVY
jgi:hypothetical protein